MGNKRAHLNRSVLTYCKECDAITAHLVAHGDVCQICERKKMNHPLERYFKEGKVNRRWK